MNGLRRTGYPCGEVTEVYAHVHTYFDQRSDSFVAMVRFAGGATALRSCGSAPYLNGWWDQDRYFVDCVRDRRPPAYPASDLDDAVRTMELIDAIRMQARGPLWAPVTA